MKKLWSMECYKLYKSAAFRLTCLGMALYAFALLLPGAGYGGAPEKISGFEALLTSLTDWEIPYLFCGIFAAFYISGDLESGGIREEVVSGFGRGKIYLVKTCMFFTGSMGILFCWQVLPTALFSAINGFTLTETQSLAGAFVRLEGIYLVLLCSCIASCVLFSFLFHKTAISVVAETVYIFVLLEILKQAAFWNEKVEKIYRIFPYGKFSLLAGNIIENCNTDTGHVLPPAAPGMLGHVSGVGGIFLGAGIAVLLQLVAGYVVFRRARL